jgi:hypothetical protein
VIGDGLAGPGSSRPSPSAASDGRLPLANARVRTHNEVMHQGRKHDPADSGLIIEFDEPESPTTVPMRARRGPVSVAVLGTALVLLAVTVWSIATPAAPSGDATPPPRIATLLAVTYLGPGQPTASSAYFRTVFSVTPLQNEPITLRALSVDERGVTVSVQPALPITVLPSRGTNITLEWTVTDCAAVPKRESSAYINLIADNGRYARTWFAIPGPAYSADLTRLLRSACPAGRA